MPHRSLVAAVALLAVAGCSRGDQQLLWSFVPVEQGGPTPITRFEGGEYNVMYAPQRDHNGDVDEAHYTFYVHNTSAQDLCASVRYGPDARQRSASDYGLTDKVVRVPAGRRIAVAAIVVPMTWNGDSGTHYAPAWSVSRSYVDC